MELNSGERQVAPTTAGIRRDHVARYEFPAADLPPGSRILDIACGIGYGSAILADAGHEVTAVDKSAEALEYAVQHYSRDTIRYINGYAEHCLTPGVHEFDAAVSFETIEHIEDPLPFLKALRECCKTLYASVPNENVIPFANWPFHYRHYTPAQFEELLTEAGFEIERWYGQRGPASELAPNIEGRTIVVKAKSNPTKAVRKAKPKAAVSNGEFVVKPSDAAKYRDALDKIQPVPEHVTILGMGPSINSYVQLIIQLGNRHSFCDEVWAVNGLASAVQCDRIFHMDDCRVQDMRAEAAPQSNIANMMRWLRKSETPVYTSIKPTGPEYTGNFVEYPLEAVLNNDYDHAGAAPYFNSTVPYAIAYAIYIGVKRISLFGVDYTLPNMHNAEKGRACCEYWLGIAAARGIQVTVPEQSTLLDACAEDRDRLYGYDMVDVHLQDQEDGKLKVWTTPAKQLPTAQEIERRYDHRQHPNRLMANGAMNHDNQGKSDESVQRPAG